MCMCVHSFLSQAFYPGSVNVEIYYIGFPQLYTYTLVMYIYKHSVIYDYSIARSLYNFFLKRPSLFISNQGHTREFNGIPSNQQTCVND